MKRGVRIFYNTLLISFDTLLISFNTLPERSTILVKLSNRLQGQASTPPLVYDIIYKVDFLSLQISHNSHILPINVSLVRSC